MYEFFGIKWLGLPIGAWLPLLGLLAVCLLYLLHYRLKDLLRHHWKKVLAGAGVCVVSAGVASLVGASIASTTLQSPDPVSADGNSTPTIQEINNDGSMELEDHEHPVHTPGPQESPYSNPTQVPTYGSTPTPTPTLAPPTMGLLQICFGERGSPAIINQASDAPPDEDVHLSCPGGGSIIIVKQGDLKGVISPTPTKAPKG